MRARKRERISSEEEERVRSGYRVTTHSNSGKIAVSRPKCVPKQAKLS